MAQFDKPKMRKATLSEQKGYESDGHEKIKSAPPEVRPPIVKIKSKTIKPEYRLPNKNNSQGFKHEKRRVEKTSKTPPNIPNRSPSEMNSGPTLSEFFRDFISQKSFKVILGILIVSILVSVFILSPAFHLSKITHNTLYFHDIDEIVRLSGLREGQHFLTDYGGSLNSFLTGNYKQAVDNIEAKYPELLSVKVQFKFPGKLHIEIEERTPIAFLDVNDGYVTLDRFGVVCGTYNNMPKGIPAIRGIEAVKMQIGENIKTNADDALKACVAVMSSLVEADFESLGGNYLLPQVKEIKSSGYQRILLRFQPTQSEENLTVSCNSSDTTKLKDDFLWLKRILESEVLNDKLPGTLDIYGSQLIFRPDESSPENSGGSYVWQEDEFVSEEPEQ